MANGENHPKRQHSIGRSVPNSFLFWHLAAGGSIDSFVNQYGAERSKAEAVLTDAAMAAAPCSAETHNLPPTFPRWFPGGNSVLLGYAITCAIVSLVAIALTIGDESIAEFELLMGLLVSPVAIVAASQSRSSELKWALRIIGVSSAAFSLFLFAESFDHLHVLIRWSGVGIVLFMLLMCTWMFAHIVSNLLFRGNGKKRKGGP